ncbi:Disintegrin and metalloproteinase domain-containing protein 1a [Myotis brandtii]|uniref:Disintegrin and metalloproteinase domain-containing protein 1a n=1 Tax=Myotis brandtii TaxID=109478 RepID=S7PZE6_MYOBR|nr:Disintegrin and metalloproteinase domain-containing protein 1a [Myotis brandtii]
MKGLALVLVPGSSCVRLGIVLVLVLTFLPSFCSDLGSAYYSSYEIVIPKALTVEGRQDPGEEASYVISMQGQKQLIHLKVKTDYFIKNFPVFSYHNGILGQEMPFISHDCHYEGYIEGLPGSFVSVNTCSGLRGILIKEGKSYGIEPMDSSKRFEHVLYTMAHQAPVSCSVTSKDSTVVSTSRQQGSRKPGGLQELSYLWSLTKYVEMFVVVNNQRFQMWGSNVNETVQRVMHIIALANSFTRGINTEVVLAGMEIWTEGDLIEVPVDLQVTLGNFNSWRQEKLLHRVKHDVAHMIVGQHPAQGMGQAFLNGACSSGFAAAVESFHHEDVLLFAALMVHELGHNLGIRHDHSACICRDKPLCLMQDNITKESGFSNCSSDDFYQFLQEHRGACLFNNPQRHKGRLRRGSYCGNGVVEAAVESFHHEDVLLFAALMVHELGHNLGIRHDHSACICRDKPLCLMQDNITKESGFSNCSSDDFYQFLQEHRGACLFNNPQRHKGRLRRGSYCGNGVVEGEEQCDCGSACYTDPCCDQTCRLKGSAECSDGLCCFGCRLKNKGFMCRSALGECDLPEYCDGTSAECPTDTYKQDGTSCGRLHYCVGGLCRNPDNQCMAMYGDTARSAPENCYISMNSKGDRFGNCGRPTSAMSRYVKCFDDNVFCGKIICTNIRRVPSIKPHHTLIQIPYEGDFCWSLDVYNITDVPDEGDVHSGTACAPNKVCMNYSCTDRAVLNYDCRPAEMCNGRGVCNNVRHCHCEAGYAPPDCRTPGNGGSVDSGSPGKIEDENLSEDERKSHSVAHGSFGRGENRDESKTIGQLVYVFPLFLLAIFLCLVIGASLGAGNDFSQCSQEAPEESEEAVAQEEKVIGEQTPKTENE